MELNSGDSVQRQRVVNVIDFDENGHRVIVGGMHPFVHKECQSCYLMFNRRKKFNCVYCAVFLKIFQGGDHTIYSPVKMDFTNSTPTNLPQTTPRPRTSVRRNLIQDFENELPTPIVTNTPRVQEIFANRENCTEVEPEFMVFRTYVLDMWNICISVDCVKRVSLFSAKTVVTFDS